MTGLFSPAEKWDVHTHTTLSPATFALLEKFTSCTGFVRVRAHAVKPCCAELVDGREQVQRVIEDSAYDGAVRVRDCDGHGVTVQVISPTPMMIPDYVDDAAQAAEICRILNDDNAETAARFPGRFVALGALPMRHPGEAVREMERIRTLGMRGVEVNSNIDGTELDHPHIFPVFEAAAALGMAVFIHPWGGFMEPQDEKLKARMNANRNWRPWLLGMGLETALAFDSMMRGRVHERLPGLRVLYAHGGGAFPALIGRLEHGAYCRPDLFTEASRLDPYRTIRECGIYTDSLTHNEAVLEMLAKIVGTDRIAMGSDYPYPLGEIDPFDPATMRDPKGNLCPYDRVKGIYPGSLIERSALFSDAEKQRMLSGTAKEWLGISS